MPRMGRVPNENRGRNQTCPCDCWERGNETYIYREYSGDSRPTLEKQVNGRPKIKIRYEE
jgi:hypothetical protein